ncbi:MAG: hypothetical protein P8Y71_07290 [Pseudolabrys sp.]
MATATIPADTVLPSFARAKYNKLRALDKRTRALRDGLSAQLSQVREQMADAQRDLAIFDRRNKPEAAFTIEEGKRVPAKFPARDELLALIDSLKSETTRLSEEINAATTGIDLNEIDRWLADHANVQFVEATVKPTKLSLDAIRQRQKEISADIATVQNAPRTVVEAKAAMRAEINRLAELGRPDVASLYNGQPLEWPTEMLVANGAGVHPHIVTATVKHTFALTVWMNRDLLIQKLDEEIEHQGDDSFALSKDEQRVKLKELENQLLLLQRQEEKLIDRLDNPPPRTCRLPEVLLGIARASIGAATSVGGVAAPPNLELANAK